MSDNSIYDLDAAIAEAVGDPFRFKLRGRLWEVPSLEAVDSTLVLEAFEDDRMDTGKAMELLAQILGDDWDEFSAGLPLAGLKGFVEKWMDHSGVNQGESQASAS